MPDNRIPFEGFVGPTYQSQSSYLSDERCINWYVEVMESKGAKVPAALMPTPGLTQFIAPASSYGRGSFAQNDRAFSVIGPYLYEVNSDGTKDNLGFVADDGLPVYMASSGQVGHELAVASGGNLYIYNLSSSAFTQVAAMNGIANVVKYLDGRFYVLDVENNRIHASDLLDGLTFNALRVRQRSTAADKWVGMEVVNKHVWLWGSQTYEVWYDAGSGFFPLEPVPNVLFSEGLAARNTARRVGSSAVMWVTSGEDGNGQVMLGGQFSAQRVSTHWVERSLQRTAGDISLCEAFVYQENGHPFYVLSTPDLTFAFDLLTGLWHERGTWVTSGPEPAQYYPLRVGHHMFAFGKHLVLDRRQGTVYEMSTTAYSDINGTELRRVRRTPHVSPGNQRINHAELILDMEMGIGLDGGVQGSNPLVMMRYSDNAGKTWGNEIHATAGPIGEYADNKRQVTFNRLGRSRHRVYEIIVSDPVPWIIGGAWLRLGR